MNIRYLFFGIIVLVFSACFKNLDPPIDEEFFIPFVDPNDYLNENPISFLNPELGQTSNFVLYQGMQYKNDEVLDDFEYKAGVVSMSIVGEDDNGFIIEEIMQPRSVDTLDYLIEKPYYYYMKVDNDQMTVSFQFLSSGNNGNNILFGDTSITLSLEPFSNQETEIVGWKTTIPYLETDETAYVNDFTLFSTTFDFLNIQIMNAEMADNQHGRTVVYSPEHGIVRTSFYLAENGSGWGWDLIDKK
ncbi:MAG: hypothetical protein DWQ02_07625 [Bacteroidetes bacterium]|nr:MAG: hypothetical protein DWQ02_07625 [Bacteroidota bacterium]